MKKKFKETKVGGWISAKMPKILDKLGESFPPAKLLSELVLNDSKLSTEQKLEFEKLLADGYDKEREYHLANTTDARANYLLSKEMADKLASKIMNWNLLILVLLIIANVVCVRYFDSVALALISNVIGMVMQQLINERNVAVNFYLGSSKGSKDKDNSKAD